MSALRQLVGAGQHYQHLKRSGPQMKEQPTVDGPLRTGDNGEIARYNGAQNAINSNPRNPNPKSARAA